MLDPSTSKGLKKFNYFWKRFCHSFLPLCNSYCPHVSKYYIKYALILYQKTSYLTYVYNKEQGFHSDLVTASCVIRCWLSTRRNVCFSVFQIGNNLERVNIEKWWNYVFSYNAITILAYEVNIPSEKQVFPHRFALTDTIMNALC